MNISNDVHDTLKLVLQSWVAATGEDFDKISCPKLKKAWKEIMDTPEKTPTDKNAVTWVNNNSKFATLQKDANWIQNLISKVNPAQLNQLKNMVMTNIEQAKQFALQIANKIPGGAQNACQIANMLIGEAGNIPVDVLPCHLAQKGKKMKTATIKINKYASGWVNTPALPGQMFKSQEELVKAVKTAFDRDTWKEPQEEKTEIPEDLPPEDKTKKPVQVKKPVPQTKQVPKIWDPSFVNKGQPKKDPPSEWTGHFKP